jgi:hypothetical protein
VPPSSPVFDFSEPKRRQLPTSGIVDVRRRDARELDSSKYPTRSTSTPHYGHPRFAVAVLVAVPTEVQRDFISHGKTVRPTRASRTWATILLELFHGIGHGDGDCSATTVQRQYNGTLVEKYSSRGCSVLAFGTLRG